MTAGLLKEDAEEDEEEKDPEIEEKHEEPKRRWSLWRPRSSHGK